MTGLTAYAALFSSAFLAATLLPAQSEAVLTVLLREEQYPVLALLLVATVGNVLGAVVNWLLGRGLEKFRDRAWFPVKGAALNRAQHWYQRYGKWSLLASWVPFIGDPLTLAAGVMREGLPVFVLLVTIAKAGRYIVLTSLLMRWS